MPEPVIYPSFYFDMDGVLCAYDYGMYKARKGQTTPPFLVHGGHAFRYIPENPAVMQAFSMLYGLVPKGNCRVLTGIPVGICQAEHTIDKYQWMRERMPGFRQEDFLCVSVPKHEAIMTPLTKLDPSCILVDDYNPNLYNWQQNGGTAIKLLNGINTENLDFVNIPAVWTASEILSALITTANKAAAAMNAANSGPAV